MSSCKLWQRERERERETVSLDDGILGKLQTLDYMWLVTIPTIHVHVAIYMWLVGNVPL